MGIRSWFCSQPPPQQSFADQAAKVAGNKARAAKHHRVLGHKLGELPKGHETCIFATGCFWGSEKAFWRVPGVYSTAVGYCAAKSNYQAPTYEQVCGGLTGAAECVKVVWDPKIVSFADLLRVFFESHDPTQGNRQGGDTGSQYRSGIYCSNDEQCEAAEAAKLSYGAALKREGKGRGSKVTTEILNALFEDQLFFGYAEDYHQQYLATPGARRYCSAEPTGTHLEPSPKWMPADSAEKWCDQLPPEYWAKYRPQPGCVLRQPDKQVSLSAL
jgi:peptide-methionine (S)-S-oxide reductase